MDAYVWSTQILAWTDPKFSLALAETAGYRMLSEPLTAEMRALDIK